MFGSNCAIQPTNFGNNLTPAENHAFNDLLLQLQSHYEFDATVVVEDVSSSPLDEYSNTESILLSSTMNEFNSQSSETNLFQEHYTNEEIENYTDMEALNTEEFQLLCDSTSIHSQNNQHHGNIKSLLNFKCESILNKSGTSLLPWDDFPVQTKETPVESNQKVKKRQFELDSGLSGSYWQIGNDETSSWAVRPRRSKAGSILKTLTKESMKRRRSQRNGSETSAADSATRSPELETSATASAPVESVSPVRRLVTRSFNKETQIKTSSLYSKPRQSLFVKPSDEVVPNLEYQYNPPLRSRLRRYCERTVQPGGIIDDVQLITEELSCFCVMAIPQNLGPTSHTSFLKGYKNTSRATKKLHDDAAARLKMSISSGRNVNTRREGMRPRKRYTQTKDELAVTPDDIEISTTDDFKMSGLTGGQTLKHGDAKSLKSTTAKPLKHSYVKLSKTIDFKTLKHVDKNTLKSTAKTPKILGRLASRSKTWITDGVNTDLNQEKQTLNRISLGKNRVPTPVPFVVPTSGANIPTSGANIPTSSTAVTDSVISDDEKPCCSKSIGYDFPRTSAPRILDNTSRDKANFVCVPYKPPVNKVHKRWIEDVVPDVVRLGNNRLLINNKLVRINYTDFIKESDLIIKLDPEAEPFESGNSVKVTQNSSGVSCQMPYCRLGCVCESIGSEEIERPHCGRPKCFFDCCCLFKSRAPTGNDGDIRSRLRPRVSLLNWKEMGRAGNDLTDQDFVVKGRSPALVKKHFSVNPVITHNRTKRNVQPPSRLRNEFVLGIEPIRVSSGRGSQLHKPENEKKVVNSKEKAEARPSKPVGSRQPVVEDGVARPSPRLSEGSQTLKQVQSSERKDDNAKLVISARYLYNHSLLRRMHNCRPCFVRLTRITSIKPATKTYKRQVAMKSASKRSAHLVYLSSQNVDKLKPTRKPVVADPLQVMEMREQNTFVLVRPNGTILSFLCWSLRKNCVPTARIYRPESGDSGSYPWLRLPVPPLDQAWMFYELPKNFTSSAHIHLPGTSCVLQTEGLAKRLWETEVHGKTQKLNLGDFLTNTTKGKYGSIYIVKNLPNVIICGPLRKKKIRPLSKPFRREAVDLVEKESKACPFIEMRFNRDYIFHEDPDFQESDTESLIALDDTIRDVDLIPPDVLMKHYKQFMISAKQTKPPTAASEGNYDFQFDLDSKFRKERPFSPSDLITELEDEHGMETDVSEELSPKSGSYFLAGADEDFKDDKIDFSCAGTSEYEVIVIDDDDDGDEVIPESQTKTIVDRHKEARMASQLLAKVHPLSRPAPPGSVLVPLSGNSNIYFLVAPIK